MSRFFQSLNIFSICRLYRVKLWQCPPFLFLVFGVLTILVMLATYSIADQFLSEDQVVLLVTSVTIGLFIIGYAIVSGFERLAETSILKSEFVSIVSHQLRTPLSSMRWLIEFMSSERSEPLSSEQKNQLDMLHEINARMLRLVNLLLEVNQVEEGRLVLERAPVDLRRITESVVKDFYSLAQSRNISISLEGEEHPPLVIADGRRLGLVIQNLIDNAIQYSRQEGHVKVMISREGGRLHWSVEDQGVGISKFEQRKIFEKFFRARNAARFQTRGSGLGLFIAKSSMEAMGGNLHFVSEENKGSRFWFHLPIKS